MNRFLTSPPFLSSEGLFSSCPSQLRLPQSVHCSDCLKRSDQKINLLSFFSRETTKLAVRHFFSFLFPWHVVARKIYDSCCNSHGQQVAWMFALRPFCQCRNRGDNTINRQLLSTSTWPLILFQWFLTFSEKTKRSNSGVCISVEAALTYSDGAGSRRGQQQRPRRDCWAQRHPKILDWPHTESDLQLTSTGRSKGKENKGENSNTKCFCHFQVI